MKCPRCDADLSTQKKCGKCGFNIADSRDELEVEYKDFKTSELLEIRRKKQTAPPVEEDQYGADAVKSEIPTATPLLEAKKSSFPILTFVVLILALLIGGFFLMRILVQK